MDVRTALMRKTDIYVVSKDVMNASSAVASTRFKAARKSDKSAAVSSALSEAVCIEIFGGKARLSKKLRSKFK